MAKTLLGSTNVSSNLAFGTTRDIPIGGGINGVGASAEARAQVTCRQGGVFSNLWINVTTNTLDTGNTTLKYRVGGANGNQVCTIAFGTTGEFIDNTNTDTASAGNLINLRIVSSGTAGLILWGGITETFAPTVHHTKLIASSNAGQAIAASTTNYYPLIGGNDVTVTEADSQADLRVAGTLRNFQINITVNTRSDTTTFRTRIDTGGGSGNGNQLLTVLTTVTGSIEDTSNTDTIVAGYLVNGSVVTGGGTGSITFFSIYSELDNSTNNFEMGATSSTGRSHSTTTTHYMSIYSFLTGADNTEGRQQQNAQFDFIASNIRVKVKTNAATTNSTFKLRKNAANGNQVATITALTTGWFMDATNTDMVVAGDLLAYQLVVGTVGAVVITAGLMTGYTGIQFDAVSNSGYQTAQSTYSWSHTCTTDSSRYLVVGVSMLSVLGSTVTGVTYNSVAMTFLGAKASVSGAVRVEQWGLIAPATGANNVAVTLSTGLDSAAGAISFSGVHQTSPTEGFNSATATNVGAADATVAITTVANYDLVVDTVATDDTAITVGAGQISRWNLTGTLGSGAGSTEGLKTPAGSVTMSWANVAALATWSIAGIALRDTLAPTLTTNQGNFFLVF